jgi:hypothetical protein
VTRRAKSLLIPAILLLTARPSIGQVTTRVAGASMVDFGVKGLAIEGRIGRIRDIVADLDGNVAILDEEKNEVRLSSIGGRATGIFRGGGVGQPHELLSPTALSIDRHRQLLVLDARGEQVLSLRYDPGGTLTLLSRVRLRVTGHDLCTIGDRLFVLGRVTKDPREASSLVHVFARDGRYLRSFGEPFGDVSPFGQIALGFGHLLCLPQERLVIVTSRLYPEVRAYSANGRLAWRMRISPHSTVEVVEPTPTRVTYRLPESGFYHTCISLYSLPDGVIGLQLGVKSNESRDQDEFRAIVTHHFSATTGKALGTQTDLPFIAFRAGKRLFSFRNGSSPSVTFTSLHSEPRQ